MSGSSWAVIEARCQPGEVSSFAWVAGISLVVRALRSCQRAGFVGARLLVAEADAKQAIRAVQRAALPSSFPVEVDVQESPTPGPTASEGVPVDARGLYLSGQLQEAAATGARTAPDLTVRSRAQRGTAQRRLFAETKKNIALDGLFAFFLIRPLSRIITRVWANTPLSHHLATAVALALGLLAATAAALGPAWLLWAGILYFVTGVFDCVDGDLARLRLAQSRLGAWLDSLTDEIVTMSLLLGIGIGLGAPWLYIAASATIVGGLTLGRLYYDLSRLGLPIDTAVYPWFFLSGVDSYPPKGAGGKIAFGFGFLIRRDANVTFISAALILGYAVPTLLAVATVLGAVTLLLLVHLWVSKDSAGTP